MDNVYSIFISTTSLISNILNLFLDWQNIRTRTGQDWTVSSTYYNETYYHSSSPVANVVVLTQTTNNLSPHYYKNTKVLQDLCNILTTVTYHNSCSALCELAPVVFEKSIHINVAVSQHHHYFAEDWKCTPFHMIGIVSNASSFVYEDL